MSTTANSSVLQAGSRPSPSSCVLGRLLAWGVGGGCVWSGWAPEAQVSFECTTLSKLPGLARSLSQVDPLATLRVQPVSSLITPFGGRLAGRVPRFLSGTLLHGIIRKFSCGLCRGSCFSLAGVLFGGFLVCFCFCPFLASGKLAVEGRTEK